VKVALYARVSSERQAEKDLSIAAQLKALRKHASKNDWTVCREFIDEAESAKSANRPAFQEMIAYARKKTKPFDAILVWKYSRFTRNRDDASIYKSLLRRHGVSVISMNEQIDDSPAGKLLEGIIEVIDEFYSLNLAQDTMRGLRENAMRGFQNGSIPIGYKAKKVMDGTVQRTKLEIDETTAPIVKRIFKMSLDNIGIKEIAKTLNNEGLKTNKDKPWGNTTIAYILKNEIYTGTLVWNKKSKDKFKINKPDEIVRVENSHPAIIEKQVFHTVQKLISKRSPKFIHPRRINSDYVLSGFIYCGKCGLKMVGASAKSGKHFYYACQNYIKRGKDICDMRLVNKEDIESLVINKIKENVLTEENLMELLNIVLDEMNKNKDDSKERLEAINLQLEALRERLGRLYNSLETGKLDLDDLAPRIKELKSDIHNLEIKRNEIIDDSGQPKSIRFNLNMLKSYVADLADLLSKGSIVEQKGFLRSFIKRIEITRPKVTIDYTMPLKTTKTESLTSEVLPLEQVGCPAWARTRIP